MRGQQILRDWINENKAERFEVTSLSHPSLLLPKIPIGFSAIGN